MSETRFATVAITADTEEDAARIIGAYLPGNYRVTDTFGLWDSPGRNVFTVRIEGEDRAGWTLEGYVLPRLASGLYFAAEVPR